MYELVNKMSSKGMFILLSIVILSGCAKTYTINEPNFTTKQPTSPIIQEAGSRYLPKDDGIPLSPPEIQAFNSIGFLDRNLKSEDLRDISLHFKTYLHSNRATVEQNIQRGQFYMPYIQQVLQEEGLPLELSYLAFIESGYNPMARSRSGAVGMWQFMPATGTQYTLFQDNWVDLRRDPYASTKAAATYLGRLYGIFKDWHLAITAYNAGEGRVSRGLASTGANNFFELRRRNNNIPNEKDRLSDEAQQYLPKLLAVCKIMRNLGNLGFKQPNFALAPKVIGYQTKPNTNLQAMSKSLGLSWDEFSKHNPAFEGKTSHANKNTVVYVPQHLSGKAMAFLDKPVFTKATPPVKALAVNKSKPVQVAQQLTQQAQAKAQQVTKTQGKFINYKVQSGESLWAIARKFQIAPLDLLALNNFTRETALKPGDIIRVAVQ